MKKNVFIFIIAGFIVLAIVLVFLFIGKDNQGLPEEAAPEKKEPIVLDVEKNNTAAEIKKPAAQENPERGPENQEYKIINLSSNLSVMLMSSSENSEYFPDDYLIGDLISFIPSSLKQAINKIDTLLASMSLGEYPEDLFHLQTGFYLRERLDTEIDRNNAPMRARIGWPLTETETQLNIPVKFIRRRDSASGEIIFEKAGENWFIIDIAIDFAELTRSDSEVIIYDDLKFN